MIDVIAAALLVTGCLLALIAGIGLLRFPDVISRMHGGTKPQTLGLVLVLLAIALRAPDGSSITILALVAIFAFMTAPVSAHMVGRAAFRAGRIDRSKLTRDELP